MSYILNLASWYPSKEDKFNGDFVQRHAKNEDNYYAPYFDGAFDRNMALLNKNPELAKKVDNSINAALGGHQE